MTWKFDAIPKHIVLALVLFVSIASISVYRMKSSVNSPDEAANVVFVSTWKQTQTLSQSLPVSQTNSYPLFPRSAAATGSAIVPTGFVGLPILFGTFAIIFGIASAFYITIFFTAIAALGFWYLVKNIFSRGVADISVWLFLFHPAVLYYSVRGLFPNMLMMDLIIISAAAAWYSLRHSSRAMALLGVLSALAACAVRPPEAFVIATLIGVAAFIFGSKKIRRVALWSILSVVAVAALFFLARSRGLLPGGYQFLNSYSIGSILFPFGFYLARILRSGYYFAVYLFFPVTLAAAAGFIWYFYNAFKQKIVDKEILGYSAVFVVVSVWLFALYGSWVFSDNLQNKNAVTLGASYVRYWIPFFVLSIPFVGIFVRACAARFSLSEKKISALVVSCAVLFGLWRSFFGADGILWVTDEVAASRSTVSRVLEIVPNNAVIAVRAWDKYFFPHRAVLQPFPKDARTFLAVRELLARGTPVFAFIEGVKDTDRLWLRDNGFAAEEVEKFGGHTLYTLKLWTEKQ